jgi:surfeit locus 1 family protein
MIYFRPQLWMTVFAVLGVALLVWLGQWQLQRLDWKLGLIEAVAARTDLPPVPVAEAIAAAAEPESLRYRPASAEGVYDHARSLYLFHHAGGEIGYLIFTPLMRDDGPPLWVNRGFIPQGLRAPDLEPPGQVAGRVTVEGLLRLPSEGGSFVPDPDPAARTFYARDIAAMSAFTGLGETLPVYLEAGPSETAGWPRGGTTRIEFRNSHLAYALTWFSLAGVLIAIYLVYHVTSGRLGRRSRSSRGTA